MDLCCWADDYLKQPSVTESVILRANCEELRLWAFRSIWSANNSPFFLKKKKQWRRRRRRRKRSRRCALTGFQQQQDVKSRQKFLLQGQTKHQTNFPSVVLNESTHLSTWHQCIPERLTKLWSDFNFLTHCYADSTLILLSQVLMDLEVGPAQLTAGPWCHFTFTIKIYSNSTCILLETSSTTE